MHLHPHIHHKHVKLMSAADEGVLKGLNEKMDLKFIKRITEGAEECTACVNIKN